MRVQNIIIYLFCLFISLTIYGCSKVEEVNTTIVDVKVIKEQLKQAEQARQQAEEQLKSRLKEIEDEQKHARQVEEEGAGFTRIIKWIVWISGIGGLMFILFSPLRNLFQRVLFKKLTYKPRRFNKDDE